ncbi:lachesin-like [Sarcoptes scabiei]|nr:lachesin-like [Sarcoptes scabiei]
MSIAMANTNNNNNNLMGVAGKIQRLKQRQQQQNEILMMAADGRNCESLKRFGKIDPQQQSNLSQNHQDRFKARSDGQESAIKIKRSLSNFDSTFFRSHSNRIESVREQVEQTKSSTNLFWPIDDHHNLLQQHQQQANHHPCLWDLRNGKIDRVSINNGIDNPWRLKRPDYRCDGSSRNSDISTSASGSRMHLSFEILNEQIHNRLQNEMLGMKFGSITVTEQSLNSNYDSNGDCLKRKESDGLVADVLNITNESNNIERKSSKSKQKKFNIIDPYDRHYRPGGGFDQNFILKRLTPTAGLNENDPFQQFNWKSLLNFT